MTAGTQEKQPARPRRLPRTVRLDASDLSVFERAAEPGEWAVSGGFEFLNDSEATLSGKRWQGFRSGFLGVNSLGRSSLVTIAELDNSEYESVIAILASRLFEHFGAPDAETALRAAREEIAYAESLCEYETNTLLALEREMTEEGINERFKRFIPSGTSDWENAKPVVLEPDPEPPVKSS